MPAPDVRGTPVAQGRLDPRETHEPTQEGPIVLDTTGLIDRCEVWPAEEAEDGFFVTNPGGDAGILEVLWSGSECDIGSTFRFSSLQDRFQLVSSPPHIACAQPVTQHSVRLFLSSPVLAASVSADFPTGLAPSTETSGPSPVPTISGCGSPLNPEVPRVIDETGLVEQCQAWHIASDDIAPIAVTNPDGDQNQLEVSWEGTRCEDFTSLTFRRSGQGFSLSGERLEKLNDLCRSLPGRRGVRVYLRDGVAASSITASLSPWSPGTGPPPESYAPPIAEVTLGSWRLAPDEHPTSDSTSLGVLVLDPDCSAGLKDPGQVQDPLISYTVATIRVIFPVLKVQRPTCSRRVAVPMTIQLSEPLGSRQLIDAGGERFSFQQDGKTPTILEGRDKIDLTSRERARALIRDRACATTINLDRRVPDVEELASFARKLGGPDGPVDRGRAWLGHASDAAGYFNAIESYGDGVNYHAIVAAPKDLGLSDTSAHSVVLTRLVALSVSGRSIWYPSFDFRALGDATVFTSAPCG